VSLGVVPQRHALDVERRGDVGLEPVPTRRARSWRIAWPGSGKSRRRSIPPPLTPPGSRPRVGDGLKTDVAAALHVQGMALRDDAQGHRQVNRVEVTGVDGQFLALAEAPRRDAEGGTGCDQREACGRARP